GGTARAGCSGSRGRECGRRGSTGSPPDRTGPSGRSTGEAARTRSTPPRPGPAPRSRPRGAPRLRSGGRRRRRGSGRGAGRRGAGAPIMPREGLVELDPEELADERGEAELLAAEELRGDHRVEDVRKAESEVALQAGQVVVRAVKDLKVPALEDRAERLEVADR